MSCAWRHFLLHLRLPFQMALAPFFLLGLALVEVRAPNWWIAFLAVHGGLYGGATVFNSYYDRDQGPIGMLRRPPPVTRPMLWASLVLQGAAILILTWLDVAAGIIGTLLAILGVAYSHPKMRWKGKTLAGLAVVALGQGCGAVLLGYASSGRAVVWGVPRLWWSAFAASILVLGLYPLTQVYQTDEDAARGDQTFAVRCGWQKTFLFSAVCSFIGIMALAHLYADFLPWPWLPVGGAAAMALLLFLTLWARDFGHLDSYGNHDRAMLLSVGISLPLVLLLTWRILL